MHFNLFVPPALIAAASAQPTEAPNRQKHPTDRSTQDQRTLRQRRVPLVPRRVKPPISTTPIKSTN
jgi:hypothetical protein